MIATFVHVMKKGGLAMLGKVRNINVCPESRQFQIIRVVQTYRILISVFLGHLNELTELAVGHVLKVKGDGQGRQDRLFIFAHFPMMTQAVDRG